MSDLHKLILDQIKQPIWENWYVKDEIGRGATGVVYRIEADRSGRRDVCALKVVPIVADEYLYPDPQKRANYIEKKRAEAQNETNIMYELRDCPYIVGYRDEAIRPIESPDGSPGYYMLIRMELLTCIQKQMKEGTFDCSEKNVRKLAHDIGNGILAAHNVGIIHRDIKPGNFFVSADGKYKLGDFNISKKSLSTRSFAGTEGFIAPEIYRARYGVDAYTNQADIYSFGISLYCMMNDMLFPFGDTDIPDDAITRRMNGEALPPPKEASPGFAKIILKACAFEQSARYKTMDEMLRDLDALGEAPAAPVRNSFTDNNATVLVNEPESPVPPANAANTYNSAVNPFARSAGPQTSPYAGGPAGPPPPNNYGRPQAPQYNNSVPPQRQFGNTAGSPYGAASQGGYAAPAKKKSKAPVIAAIVAVLAIVGIVLALLVKLNDDDGGSGKKSSSSTSEIAAGTDVPQETEAAVTTKKVTTTAKKTTTTAKKTTTKATTTTKPAVTTTPASSGDYGHKTKGLAWTDGYFYLDHDLFGKTYDEISPTVHLKTPSDYAKVSGWTIARIDYDDLPETYVYFDSAGECCQFKSYSLITDDPDLVNRLMREDNDEIDMRDYQYPEIVYYYGKTSDGYIYQTYVRRKNLDTSCNGMIEWTSEDELKIDTSLLGMTMDDLNSALDVSMADPVPIPDTEVSYIRLNCLDRPNVNFIFDKQGKCTCVYWDCPEAKYPSLRNHIETKYNLDLDDRTGSADADVGGASYKAYIWYSSGLGSMICQEYY